MGAVADDESPSLETLREYAQDGRAWVATDAADHPVAYALVDVVDGAGHVEQVSVHPSYAGQGLGRALIEMAATWAAQHDLPTLTLTTFADVPWNGPYYARLGFRVVAPDQLADGLRRVRVHEAELSLDRWPRVAMYRPVNQRPQVP
jgi:GNAT superfamily N-acetyltransferase